MATGDAAVNDDVDWDELLESLAPLDLVLLEQLYLVEHGPISLRTAQDRLSYLNVHPRTVSRHADELARRGLLKIITSCEIVLNPYPRLAGNAGRLVRLWRLREERALQARSPARSGPEANCEGQLGSDAPEGY